MFEHCLYFNTTVLARTVEKIWGKAFAPLGLTPPQGFVLRLVLENPGMPQRRIATELGISRPTATRLLDGLARKKLVERRSSAVDGRESEIHPTGRAKAIKAELNRRGAQITRTIAEIVGPDTFKATVGSLRRVRTAIEK